MILREKFISNILGRSWQEIVKGQITVKRQIKNENGGFLNAVRELDYDTYVIPHCDIFIKTDENKNTRTGIKILGDAAVWADEVYASDLIGTDIIVIGGVEYCIIKIDTYDSIYKDKSRVELMRV